MSGGVLLAILFPWAVLLLGCFIGYQLIRQNGRILLRLEAIEAALANRWSQQAPASLESLQQGLAPGTQAPPFELPDLTGRLHSLEQFRGRQVLLTFFSPTCGFCQQMAPDLAALSRRESSNKPALFIVSSGAKEANQKLVEEHGIAGPVVLQQGTEVANRYQAGGTPMGYLIDPNGVIASRIAVGGKELLALADGPADAIPNTSGNGHHAKHGNRRLIESRILRTGLPKNSAAPRIYVERLDGGELTLEQFRGRRVLLVLTSADCGPCNELAPHLASIAVENPDLKVVMIARGDRRENEQKAREFGFTFPIGLQRRWEVSTAFGIFATPAAFLIDEEGKIAADMATGVDGIVKLAAGANQSWKEAMPIAN